MAMMAAWQDALRVRKVLVTGARGYLGSALTALLVRQCGCAVLGMSRQPFAPVTGCQAVAGDVRRADAWEMVSDVEVIFHLAGETSTNSADRNPAASLEANVLPMVHLIDACKRAGHTPTIIFAGTATEAGLPMALPVDETTPDHPVTLYDLHKLTAERHLTLAVTRGWVKGGTLRLANVYGPSEAAAGASDRGILNQVVRRALNGQPIAIYGDGRQLRDYVYVEDVVEAFAAAAASAERLEGGACLVGSGVAHPFGEAFRIAARLVEARSGRGVQVDERPWPADTSPIEFRNFQADVAKLARLTGWRPRVMLDEGIGRTVEAFA